MPREKSTARAAQAQHHKDIMGAQEAAWNGPPSPVRSFGGLEKMTGNTALVPTTFVLMGLGKELGSSQRDGSALGAGRHARAESSEGTRSRRRHGLGACLRSLPQDFRVSPRRRRPAEEVKFRGDASLASVHVIDQKLPPGAHMSMCLSSRSTQSTLSSAASPVLAQRTQSEAPQRSPSATQPGAQLGQTVPPLTLQEVLREAVVEEPQAAETRPDRSARASSRAAGKPPRPPAAGLPSQPGARPRKSPPLATTDA